MTKPFAWSFSRLKNYRTCPKKHYHVEIAKDFKEEASAELSWGHALHTSIAGAIENGGKLPIEMLNHQGWVDRLVSFKTGDGFNVKVEQRLAMDRQFNGTGFFADGTWFRGVVDVLVMLHADDRSAITVDWKTGKVHPEYEQLALSSQLIFANHPEIDHVKAIYVWLAHDRETVQYHRRDDMLGTWNDVMPTVNVMEESYNTLTYPPKPSGICIRHCPVTSCPYHGKGSR